MQLNSKIYIYIYLILKKHSISTKDPMHIIGWKNILLRCLWVDEEKTKKGAEQEHNLIREVKRSHKDDCNQYRTSKRNRSSHLDQIEPIADLEIQLETYESYQPEKL